MTRESSAGVSAGYDRWAPTYATDDNPMTALESPHLRAAVGAVRGMRVLEIGCGTGRHTHWLAAGLCIRGIQEHAPEAALVRQYPRAEKYLDWPMLVLFELEAQATAA